MYIPSSHKAFSKPTLIAVTDGVQAKLYLANDHEVSEAGSLSTKLEPMHDRDRVAVKRGDGAMASGEQNELNQQWVREQLYEKLSKDLHERLKKQEYVDLVITAPQEHIEELRESLHIDVLKRVRTSVPKLLTGESLVDVLSHIENET